MGTISNTLADDVQIEEEERKVLAICPQQDS
jgi:hypothetical protein